ncbi:dTMP kinase [Pseudanabaenaceae cyanobacterium LEGE 13415]|nr:dTMP kinase [Pseudanabaenaceae cyanobacterium LEGE 13415]
MDGRLIVFEGIEGCGKSTQLERSRQWLVTQGAEVIPTREPGGTSLGGEIRKLLLHTDEEPIYDRTELLLYAADRAQHVEQFLRPHLERGALILCDRYTDSTIAYQGYGRGLDLALIDQLNQVATGGLQSDLTIWLDIDVEVGFERMKQRGKRDRIEQASIDFHQRVRMGFAKLAEENPNRIVRIDGSGSELHVAEQVKAAIRQALIPNQSINAPDLSPPKSPKFGGL